MLEWLLFKLFRHVDIIKEVDGEKVLYLRRYFLFERTMKFLTRGRTKLYLHHICRSDDDPDPHDHPWDFTTFVLSGGYVDLSFSYKEGRCLKRWEVLKRFSFRHRKAEHVHRVILRGALGNLLPRPAWTICFVGPIRRRWGFVKDDGTWVHWRTYLGFDGEDPYDRPEGQDT